MLNLNKGVFHGLLFFFCSTYFAQTYKFNRYTSSDGLLSDEIYNLYQDKKGYLWIFTDYGALKYNSTEFRQVLKNLPFNESFIYSIYENEAGNKWVANSNGKIYKIINDSAFIVKGTEETSEILRKTISEVVQLHVDDSLNIYAITKHDSYKFVHSTSGYRSINLSTGRNDSITDRIYEKNKKIFRILNYCGNDSVFCGGRENLKILLFENAKPFYFRLECNNSQPRHFKRYKKDIYFSHHDKIGKIRNGKVISVIPINAIVMNFTKDKNDHLWIACYNNGLFELNERDSIINHYFEKTAINDVLIDSQNGLWVSSSGSGLFHCENLSDLYFPQELPLGKPISFMKKFGPDLYIANKIGDIFSIKKNQIRLFREHTKEDEPFDMIKNAKSLIISNRYGIQCSGLYSNILDKREFLVYSTIKLISRHTDTVVFLKRKRLLILENGLIKKVVNFAHRAYSCEWRGNDILIAMDNGIWQIKNTRLFKPAYLKETENSIFKSIVEDSLNNFWFCSTGNGLYKLPTDNKLVHYQLSDGLPSNIVNNISFSPTGVLLSTNLGLYFTPPIKYNEKRVTWKKIHSGSVQNALFFEGKIYLSTNNGLVILEKTKLYDTENLHFNLREIKVNSRKINVSTFKNADHDQNSLEFIFDLISFNEDTYNLKYNLSGTLIDSGSVYGNTIGFQKLSPGNYTLIVYPDIRNGKKLKIEKTFCIVPAFWQTTAFLAISFVAFLFLCAYILHLVFKNLKKKEDKKTQAERLILEYRLIALKAQINPHFMSNCLSAIQHLIISNNVDQAADYIAKFGLLVRQILNFSTRSLVTLKEELEIATLNIELEQLRFEKKFLFELKIDEKVMVKTTYIPALILNPIIENAIWHGLIPLKNTRPAKLLIEVILKEDTLQLIIEDNGVGRDETPDTIGNLKDSKGITLTEQRLVNINYLFNVTTSQMVYIDLNKENSKSQGTRVIISLPANLMPLQNE